MANSILENGMVERENAVDQYNAIFDGSGPDKDVRKYNTLVEDLKALLAGEVPRITRNTKPTDRWQRWHEIFSIQLTDFSWLERLYRTLDVSELAMFLEITGAMSFSSVILRHDNTKAIHDILNSDHASLELKLALCREEYAKATVLDWLFVEGRGEHIPTLVEMLKEADYLKRSQDRIIATLAHIVIFRTGTKMRRSLILNLREDVVTVDFFTDLLKILDDPKGEWIKDELAFHARRLYSFDASIPDSWVLNAIR